MMVPGVYDFPYIRRIVSDLLWCNLATDKIQIIKDLLNAYLDGRLVWKDGHDDTRNRLINDELSNAGPYTLRGSWMTGGGN